MTATQRLQGLVGVFETEDPDLWSYPRFRINLQCGGRLRVIASIEKPAVIERILEHLGRDAESVDPAHPSRAPPERDTSL